MIRKLLSVPALLLLAGCAGTGFNTTSFQDDVLVGNYDSALERLDSFSEEDVAALLDRGLLLQAEGRYTESNAVFEKAEVLVEDLYTRSLSKEALSLLTNDRALDYRASGFEHAYISYYRAWNYLYLNEPDEVLVEARRINERLTFRSASCEDEGGACGHDLFLRYFSGLLFEWAGDWNDAYVAYKQADIARKTVQERYGIQPPPDLGPRLVRLARRLGFQDEIAGWAEAYGVDPGLAGNPSSVVFFWENGIIGHREAASVTIPIYHTETELIAKDRDAWSRKLAARRHEKRRTKVKLDYLLRISLPEYVARPPGSRRARVVLDRRESTLHPAAELSAMAARALDEAMGGIAVRAVSRALVKYLATRTADKEVGEGAGILVNLLTAVLEQADTRSWRSLPFEIQVATLEVPPGTYDCTLTVTGAGDRALETRDFPGVEVSPGNITFVRHRTF